MELLKSAEDYISGSALECRAQAVLALEKERGGEDLSIKMTRPKEPLEDRLDTFVLDESLVSGEPNVARFPPEMT